MKDNAILNLIENEHVSSEKIIISYGSNEKQNNVNGFQNGQVDILNIKNGLNSALDSGIISSSSSEITVTTLIDQANNISNPLHNLTQIETRVI